jgi:hypothetical protein
MCVGGGVALPWSPSVRRLRAVIIIMTRRNRGPRLSVIERVGVNRTRKTEEEERHQAAHGEQATPDGSEAK